MESDMTDKFTHPKDAKEGHKWQDSNGTPVDEMCYFESANRYCGQIAAVIDGNIVTLLGNGESVDGEYVVVDAPEEREVWVNLDEDGYSASFRDREQADRFANSDRIACQRFVITEGEFDDEK